MSVCRQDACAQIAAAHRVRRRLAGGRGRPREAGEAVRAAGAVKRLHEARAAQAVRLARRCGHTRARLKTPPGSSRRCCSGRSPTGESLHAHQPEGAAWLPHKPKSGPGVKKLLTHMPGDTGPYAEDGLITEQGPYPLASISVHVGCRMP